MQALYRVKLALGSCLEQSPHLTALLNKIEEHLTVIVIGEHLLIRQAPIHVMLLGQRTFDASGTRHGRKQTTSAWVYESRTDLTLFLFFLRNHLHLYQVSMPIYSGEYPLGAGDHTPELMPE